MSANPRDYAHWDVERQEYGWEDESGRWHIESRVPASEDE